jgi:DNA-binding NarL/FixJ family response regulator
MITVLLADDHKVVRQGVRALLEYEPDLEIVGEANGGAEALALLDKLRPDILVTDLSMPMYNGIELAGEIRKRGWLTKVVLLSIHGDEPYVAAAFNNGASAYVLKESGVEHAVMAIREAVAGRRYVSPPLVLPTKQIK